MSNAAKLHKQPAWMQRQERSNLLILRLMAWISLTFGRRVGRFILHGVAAYYVLFAPAARRASRAYLDKVLQRFAGWSDGYRHVFSFASTIHDRIYLLNDRFDEFDVEVIGVEPLLEALAKKPGALLVGAHLGSFEVLRAVGREKATAFRVAILMYEQNARKLNAALLTINPKAMQDVIPLGNIDSMLEVRSKLEAGYLVGMLADRSIGGDATCEASFLGEQAAFPLGPWRMAAMLKQPVYLIAGLYMGGNRYQVHFEHLADFSSVHRTERDAAVHAAVQAYADSLARLCKAAPYNWFNFFDFWKKP